jgi:hypothetical protein
MLICHSNRLSNVGLEVPITWAFKDFFMLNL